MKYHPSMAVNKNYSVTGHLFQKKKIESVNNAYINDIWANMFRKLGLVFGGRMIYLKLAHLIYYNYLILDTSI